jgi:integrase
VERRRQPCWFAGRSRCSWVVFHSLRHTGISRLANDPRVPLVKVRDFARHANLATTQGYVHAIESPDEAEIYDEALGARK